MGDSGKSLQKSVELGATSFGTFNALRSLARAACRDDVQPEAVLAVEALAGSWIFSDDRIAEGYNALGGNETTRLRDLQVLVGYSAGGLRQEMRRSSALVRIFLLCAACKLCYVDSDIAGMLFEMAKAMKLVNKFPISPEQLGRFVQQFSAHAESIVPVQLFEEVARVLDQQSEQAIWYSPFAADALAKLLCQTFSALSDTSTAQVTLDGHENGAWLATALMWLLEGDVAVIVEKELVFGQLSSRVQVQLGYRLAAEWQLKIWKRDVDPLTMVFKYQNDLQRSVTRLPVTSLRSYIHCFFLPFHPSVPLDDSDTGQEISAIDLARAEKVMSTFAQALVHLLLSRGALWVERPCCSSRDRTTHPCTKAWVSSLAASQFTSNLSDVLRSYGYNSYNSDEARTLSLKLDEITNSESMITQPPHERKYISELQSAWDSYLSSRLSGSSDDQHATSGMFDMSVYLAVDALLTCTVNMKSGVRYTVPPSPESTEHGFDTLEALLHHSMSIQSFIRLALRRCLPGLSSRTHSDQDLIVQANGYVAGMSMIWHPSTCQSDALGIMLMKGTILSDGIPFESVRELPPYNDEVAPGNVEEVTFSRFGRVMCIDRPSQPYTIGFETLVSLSGRIIELKRFVVATYSDGSTIQPRRACWLDAIANVACGHHLDRTSMGVQQEAELTRRLSEQTISEPIYWTGGLAALSCSDPRRLIIMSVEPEETAAFAVYMPRPKACHPIVYGHGAPLARTIEFARRISTSWIIVP